MLKSTFDSSKMYTFIKGYASGLEMKQTLCALAFARSKHEGQLRKSGEPYIVHPLTMACDALSLGIKDDNTIATILLHDVCEDCGISVEQLPVMLFVPVTPIVIGIKAGKRAEKFVDSLKTRFNEK